MSYRPFIEHIARKAGELAMTGFRKPEFAGVEFKSDRDLVTAVDRQVEAYIIGEIQDSFPEHSIFGEETGRADRGSDYCWVIDPIDGTTSFVHGQPFFSTSIALYCRDEAIAGAVYGPVINELFLAEKGCGATLNGEQIHVSSCPVLLEAVLATGFACLRAERPDNNLKYFNHIAPRLRGVRRYGSAALDLAYVACGRLDGFWEIGLAEYDLAAGALLVKEAGGVMCDFEGGQSYPQGGTVATNGRIHDELLTCLREAK